MHFINADYEQVAGSLIGKYLKRGPMLRMEINGFIFNTIWKVHNKFSIILSSEDKHVRLRDDF